jgi:adenylate cyclase
MTETHGADSAADLVEKFMEIVHGCLVGDCRLHSRTGDEVVIVSYSADELLTSAIQLVQKTSGEDNFLQLHGGLHYGKILNRGGNYFGTTINLASRIASRASSGTLWCSRDYLDALENKSALSFHPKGKYAFKNLSEEFEISELVISELPSCHIDPVCKMRINEPEKAIRHPEEANIFFCSDHCYSVYRKNAAQE